VKPVTVAPILLALNLAGCNPANPGGGANTGEASRIDTRAQGVAELKAVEDQFLTAFTAKDVNAIMQICVPDDSLVVFDVHPPREYRGAEAYRKDWEDLFNRFSGPLQAEISEVEAVAGEDVGYVHSIHHVAGAMKNGKQVDYMVRVTDGFKKINGKWLIAHTHVSFPVDPQTGNADMQSKP
jgi:ketosteroid isomerase-like protein